MLEVTQQSVSRQDVDDTKLSYRMNNILIFFNIPLSYELKTSFKTYRSSHCCD